MNSYQGINSEELQKDILKLDYQNNEINKELTEFCIIKKEIEKKYTTPINQEEINNILNHKIEMLKTNRDNDISLLKDKIILYDNVVKETENKLDKVETNIVIE